MFIRDLEYCQIEVSDNQFALVNGGGKTKSSGGKKHPPVTLPSFASAFADGAAIASGTTLAVTVVETGSLATAGKGSASSASTASSLSIAQSSY